LKQLSAVSASIERDIRLEAKSTVTLEACSYEALRAVSSARAVRPSFIDRRLMASSIANHTQLSHLHASSMTADLASSRMSDDHALMAQWPRKNRRIRIHLDKKRIAFRHTIIYVF
jgi:hypothetical protein